MLPKGVLRGIHTLRWFGAARARGYCAVLLLVSVPLMIAIYQAAARTGVDSVAFWAAGKLAWTDPAASYDLEALSSVQRAAKLAICSFVNPPPFLAMMKPLGLLPYPAALLVFILSTLAVYTAALWRISPLAPGLAYTGVMLNVCFGQNGLLTGGLFIASMRLLERRPYLAGAVIGCLVIKPQLAILMPIALGFGGHWRAFVAAAVSATSLLLLSWLLLGTSAYSGFLEALVHQPAYLFNGTLQRWMVSPFAVALSLGFAVPVAIGLQALCSGGAAVVVAKVWRAAGSVEAKAAALAVMTPFATPYLYSYDLVLLYLPILWLAKQGAEEPWPWERWIIGAAFFAPILGSTLASRGGWVNPGLFVNVLLAVAVLRRISGTRPQQAAAPEPA